MYSGPNDAAFGITFGSRSFIGNEETATFDDSATGKMHSAMSDNLSAAANLIPILDTLILRFSKTIN